MVLATSSAGERLFFSFLEETLLPYQETSAGQRWKERSQELHGSAVDLQTLEFPTEDESVVALTGTRRREESLL